MKRLWVALVQRAEPAGYDTLRFPHPVISQFAIAASWIVLTLIAAICVASTSYAQSGLPKGGSAGGKEFSPITTNLLGHSTTRDAVDIEIVGSTSVVPREHVLQPDHILRLRLERAYIVGFHTKADPGFSLPGRKITWPISL